jgi:hypothetical protein
MEINDPIDEKDNLFFVCAKFGTVLTGRDAVEEDQELVGLCHGAQLVGGFTTRKSLFHTPDWICCSFHFTNVISTMNLTK